DSSEPAKLLNGSDQWPQPSPKFRRITGCIVRHPLFREKPFAPSDLFDGSQTHDGLVVVSGEPFESYHFAGFATQCKLHRGCTAASCLLQIDRRCQRGEGTTQ